MRKPLWAEGPGLARLVPAGLLDAGASSLATFAIGVFAVRSLDPSALGIYALFFTASHAAAVVPSQLFLVPAEVRVLGEAPDRRRALVRQTLKPGLLLALGSASVLVIAVVVSPPDVGSVKVPFAYTALAVVLLSPLQDHVRRLLHLASRSWGAATVSVVQFLAVLGGLASLSVLGLPTAWIPFGALAVANAISLALGLVLCWGGGPTRLERLPVRELARSGRWLLAAGLIPAGSAFLAAALVAHLAGATALGFAEGARVVGQPVLVLAMGLGAVVRPRSMEAAATRSGAEARRIDRLFRLLIATMALPYLVLVGVVWPGNPLPNLLPNAYAVEGLVAVKVVANLLVAMSHPLHFELLGGRREVKLAQVELIGNALRAAVAAGSRALGSFAIPLGFLVLGLVRLFGYRRTARLLYQEPMAEAAGP